MATAVQPDVIAQMLGGAAAKPWFFATVFLVLLVFFFLFMTIMMAKRTNGFRELRASLSGKRILHMYDDTRTYELRIGDPSAGMISDEIYGDYIINEKGTYVDKRTRNVVIPFSSQLAMGAEVKHFQAADHLAKLLGDEKELQKISLLMANGEFKDESFDALKTSINFSALKSFANTLIPHNITAKINLEVAKRVKSYGAQNTKAMMYFVIIGIGLILLAAIVAYFVLKKGDTTVIVQAGQTMAGFTNSTMKGALSG